VDPSDHTRASEPSEGLVAAGRPHRADGYRVETIDQDLLLFDPGQSVVLYCNETAALVWGLCDGTRSVEDIITLLAKAYPEAGPGLALDVRQTVADLAARRALRFASSGGS
jgi:hypothetical protein